MVMPRNKRQPQTIISVVQLKEAERLCRFPIHHALSKARTKNTLKTSVVTGSVTTASYPPCRSSRTLTGTRNHGEQRLSISSPPAAKRNNLSKRKGIPGAFRPESIARGPDSGDLNFVVVPQKAWISRQHPVRSI